MKKENLIFICLLIFVVLITMICGYFAFQQKNEMPNKTDAIKIKEEYAELNGEVYESTKQKYPEVNLSDSNPFLYKSEEEIIKILEEKSGIIYFGFAACPWCRTIMPILEEVAKEENISEIYYLDIKNIRDTLELDENDKVVQKIEGTAGYSKILNLLNDYLEDYTLKDKKGELVYTGKKRLYAPSVVLVKNGAIESVHFGTLETHKNGFDPLNKEEKQQLMNIYRSMFQKLKEDSCNEGC